MGRLRARLGRRYAVDSRLVRWSSLYVYARLWLVGDVPSPYTVDGLSTRDLGKMLPDLNESAWGERLDRQNGRVIALGQREGWVTVPLHEMGLDPAVFEDPIHVDQEGERRKGEAVAEALVPVLDARAGR